MKLFQTFIALTLLIACKAPKEAATSEVKGGGGSFEIREFNGLCLDVPNWSKEVGKQLKWWHCTGEAKQKWRKQGNMIVSVYNNKAIDFSGGGRIVQWDWTGGWNQQVQIRYYSGPTANPYILMRGSDIANGGKPGTDATWRP
jgi:hypothetical protein